MISDSGIPEIATTATALALTIFRNKLIQSAAMRAVVGYVRGRAQAPRDLALIRQSVLRQEAEIADIKKSLEPNGGGSVIDAIRRIEAKQRTRDSIMRFALVEFSADGELVYVSEQAAIAFGETSEHLLKRSWMSYVHPADKENAVREFLLAVSDRRKIFLSFRLRDGKQVQLVAEPTMDVRSNTCVCWQGQIEVAA